MTPYELHEVKTAYLDAKAKVEAAPQRILDEIAAAERSGKTPRQIMPLGSIRAALLVAVIEAIKKVPDALVEIAREKAATCKRIGDAVVHIRAEELQQFVEASGLLADKPEPPKKESA